MSDIITYTPNTTEKREMGTGTDTYFVAKFVAPGDNFRIFRCAGDLTAADLEDDSNVGDLFINTATGAIKVKTAASTWGTVTVS